MAVPLPLDEMSVAEKLRVLEAIWEDLCRHAEDVPSPTWHGDVLKGREEAARNGVSLFTAWTEARQRIRDAAR